MIACAGHLRMGIRMRLRFQGSERNRPHPLEAFAKDRDQLIFRRVVKRIRQHLFNIAATFERMLQVPADRSG